MVKILPTMLKLNRLIPNGKNVEQLKFSYITDRNSW